MSLCYIAKLKHVAFPAETTSLTRLRVILNFDAHLNQRFADCREQRTHITLEEMSDVTDAKAIGIR